MLIYTGFLQLASRGTYIILLFNPVSVRTLWREPLPWLGTLKSQRCHTGPASCPISQPTTLFRCVVSPHFHPQASLGLFSSFTVPTQISPIVSKPSSNSTYVRLLKIYATSLLTTLLAWPLIPILGCISYLWVWTGWSLKSHSTADFWICCLPICQIFLNRSLPSPSRRAEES